MAVGLGFQRARHQREDPLGRRGRDLGTRRAPLPSLATPEKEWCARSADYCSSSGTGRYVSHAGKGATYPSLVMCLRPSREARHRHHGPLRRLSTAEPSTRDGTR